MNELTNNIKKYASEYGSIPFWSWNDRLEEKELRRQIRNMYDMEMRGFFMHARGGLETEYMSNEWYDCVKVCIDEAKTLGMEAWAYDENGWPSGFAGGKLLEDPDNHAIFIEAERSESYPETNENTVAVYAFDVKGMPRLTECEIECCEGYLRINMGTDGSYVDTMRADVVKKFIDATYEDYKMRLGGDFGKTMPGFFTDEPQYYRWKTPYSRKMEEWFLKEYGYSVKVALPALFVDYEGAEEHRYDYHRLTSKKFTENFSKQLYQWCDQNGIKLTGHFIEEKTLRGQMLCCGDIMPQYLYEHIPGMDYLGRGLQTDIAPKQLGSICAQTGRKKVLSEMFACCGWDVSPKELKAIAELQYAGGVTIMCQHLYPYSIRGQRKRDYPSFYSEHNLWQSEMKNFDRYFNNLGYMLSLGKECADTLVIHPMHSAWLHYQRINDGECIDDLDEVFSRLTYLLSGNQIGYHFGSETVMADMARLEGGCIVVGECRYKQVIVAPCDTLDESTVSLLRAFCQVGGKVYVCACRMPSRIDGRVVDEGALDFLRDKEDIFDAAVFERFKIEQQINITLPRNADVIDVRMMARDTEYGRLIYIANLSDKELYGVDVSVKSCKCLGVIDILTLGSSSARGQRMRDNLTIRLDLMGHESIMLCEYKAPELLPILKKNTYAQIKLDGTFVPEYLPKNYLTLDRVRASLNGGDFTKLCPIERIRDELLSSRFGGELTLSFPFDVIDIPKELEVIIEPHGIKSMSVNGESVTIGNDFAIDRSFRLTDISQYVRKGENSIELTMDYRQNDYVYYVLYGGVSESLRNCLVFDTEIECIYLRGSFALNMKKENFIKEANNGYRYDTACGISLVAQKETIDISNIVTDGYPFYCGELRVSTILNYKVGDPTRLRLLGRYSTAHIEVNGQKAADLLFSEYAELSEYLREGENILTVTLVNNYRNLLGPHHGLEAEPMSVGPHSFSFEKMWKNGKCDAYDERYSFVRFGIDIG